MSVAKEASAATVSGGHPGMYTSSYACNVLGVDSGDERVVGFKVSPMSATAAG